MTALILSTRRILSRVGAGLCLLAFAGSTVAAQESADSEAPAASPLQKKIDRALSFLPPVVAAYQDMEVTAEEVKTALPNKVRVSIVKGDPPPRADLKQAVRNVAQGLIDNRILMAEAKAAGYAPDYKAAKQKVAEQEARIGMAKFNAMLQRRGVTRIELIKQIARQMAFRRWISQHIIPQIEISEERLKAIYEEDKEELTKPEQVYVSHILVAVDKDASGVRDRRARQRAEDILTRLQEGASFENLARVHSDDDTSQNGGRIGWMKKSGSLPEFEDAAFSLQEGELSNVVETRFGYHIIRCEDRREGGTQSFEEARDGIAQTYVQEQVNAELKRVLKEAHTDESFKLSVSGE